MNNLLATLSECRSEKFQKERGHNCHIFSSLFCFGRTKLKELIEKKRKVVGESGGMLPQKKFENLHVVMAILVFFE